MSKPKFKEGDLLIEVGNSRIIYKVTKVGPTCLDTVFHLRRSDGWRVVGCTSLCPGRGVRKLTWSETVVYQLLDEPPATIDSN